MKKIPTAEDFLYDKNMGIVSHNFEVERFLIEFAKLHVEAALKKAHKDARIVLKDGSKVIAFGQTGGEFVSGEIDKHSITNAYPLTNIK